MRRNFIQRFAASEDVTCRCFSATALKSLGDPHSKYSKSVGSVPT
jgi:hypothetical protein